MRGELPKRLQDAWDELALLRPVAAERWSRRPEGTEELATAARMLADAQREALASECYRHALALAPSAAPLRVEWARVLTSLGQCAHAVEQLKTAIVQSPDVGAYRSLLAKLLFWHLGRPLEAIDVARNLAITTGSQGARELLAECLARLRDSQGCWSDAEAGPLIDRLRELLGPSVSLGDAARAVAAGLLRMGRHEEAADLAAWLCEQQPVDVDALCTLGWSLTLLGRPREAASPFERAFAASPESQDAAWSVRRNRHSLGLYQAARDAWLQSPQLWAEAHAGYGAPPWDGAPLTNRTIRLRYDRNFGFGDAIQFVRFAAWLKERGATVDVVAPHPLVRLLSGAAGVRSARSPFDDLGDADYDCPGTVPWMLLDIPMTAVAGTVPYLAVDTREIERWRRRIAVEGELAVGVAWESSDSHSDFRRRPLCGTRSMPLLALRPLSSIPGVRLYSLQKRRAGSPPVSPFVPLVDFTDASVDFRDLAPLAAALDIVVTVDTSIAHLAGALGRPTIVLLPYAAGWLWEVGRCDSPWYPTMTLVRQSQRGVWSSVVAEVASRLEAVRVGRLDATRVARTL